MPNIYIIMKNKLGLMVYIVVIITTAANMGSHDVFQKTLCIKLLCNAFEPLKNHLTNVLGALCSV
jgi:hypothetical protein